MKTSYDVVIVGAGLVGLSLAHALHGHNLDIALIDAKPLSVAAGENRAIALSRSSYQILETLGLWKKLSAYATPIETVHISRRGLFSKAHLRASDAGVNTLGYVVPAYDLASQMIDSLKHLSELTTYTPASLESIEINSSQAELVIRQGAQTKHLSAKLVIAADGSQSSIAKYLDIHQEQHDYQQTAIVASLTLDRERPNEAYERFTEDGVIALLPLRKKEYGVVWTAPREKAEKLLALSTEEYLSELKKQISHYWGKNPILSARSCYPLIGRQSMELVRPRVVILGNAAHTLHPVAAQGLNMALRSVAWLSEFLLQEKAEHIGDLSVLKKYSEQISQDHKRVQQYTDGIVTIHDSFSNASLWNLGLGLFDKIAPLKKHFIQQAMGLSGKQSKLVRGVTL